MPHATIKDDLVVRISGPGWAYGIARLQIDTDGQAAVFVPPGDEPVQIFQTLSGTNPMKGASADGSITWTRRGSGCSFKLAKCQVSKEKLALRW